MALLYANENFPLGVVKMLRLQGHDVLTTFEAGNAGQAIPDSAVLGYAVQSNRAVLTLNRSDFIRLHRQSPKHAGSSSVHKMPTSQDKLSVSTRLSLLIRIFRGC